MIRASRLLIPAVLAALIPVAGAAGGEGAATVSVLDDNPHHTAIEYRFGDFNQRDRSPHGGVRAPRLRQDSCTDR